MTMTMRFPWWRWGTRRRILRGVVRQNQVILGHVRPGRLRRRLAVRPSLLLAAILAVGLMLVWGRPDTAARTRGESADPIAAAVAGSAGGAERAALRLPAAPTVVPPGEYDGLTGSGGVPIRQVFGLGVRTIMIDPGHGGEATGAIGHGGTREKEITLDIALKLRDMLRRDTATTVLMTRETDVDLPLKERVALANSRQVDLFVSVHVNSLPSKPLDIIETYYFGPSKDREMLEIAAAENEGSSYNISDYGQVIREIANQLKFQESRDLADRIQTTLFASMKLRNKNVLDFGVKRAPFMVLLDVDMPGVLVEVACLSNREEENRLRDPAYRESIAGYLERGIISYLNDRSGT